MAEIVDFETLKLDQEIDDARLDQLSHAAFDLCLHAARAGISATELIRFIGVHYHHAVDLVGGEDEGGTAA
jgi:hypothetical protein